MIDSKKIGPYMDKNTLTKKLGFFDVFCIASGAMISSGLFILPGLAHAAMRTDLGAGRHHLPAVVAVAVHEADESKVHGPLCRINEV